MAKQRSSDIRAKNDNVKFMQIMMADDITPHCGYRNNRGFKGKMSRQIFERSLEFCRSHGFLPALLCHPEDLEEMGGIE